MRRAMALYFQASSSAPSVSWRRLSLSPVSQMGPRGLYIRLPKKGILRMSTLSPPVMFPWASSARTISLIQLDLTWAHWTDCWKLHRSWRERNSVYSCLERSSDAYRIGLSSVSSVLSRPPAAPEKS